MALLDDIITQLEADGVSGGVTGWTSGKSFMPPNPDKMIVVYETGGDQPDQTAVTGYSYPTFQVRGRSDELGYEELRTKMQAVMDSLKDADITGYIYIHPVQSGLLFIGYDANQRPEAVINFKAMKG